MVEYNMQHKSGCFICGEELKYHQDTVKKNCFYCGEEYETLVTCKNDHFVCDKCHSLSANDIIEKTCIQTEGKDPLKTALLLMKNPKVKMHGPEHHFLVPAVLLSAYYNIKEVDKKEEKIKQARKRAEKILGGFCGSHGVCGAAVGTGIFISLITGASPLSKREWKLSNCITANCLKVIAEHGGPRCCKRNTLLAIKGAIDFLKEKLNEEIKINDQIICNFSNLNKECLQIECPFYPGQ